MLKHKLDKIEGLPPEIVKEYKADPAGGFVLDLDVEIEDVKPLKNALVQEKKHRKEATEKVTELETEVAELKAKAPKPSDLEKSWQEKLATKEKAFKERETVLQGQLRTLLVENVAQGIASEVSSSPELLIPHILPRLTVEEVDGKPITRVLTLDGKASALSVNELKTEIIDDKRFAPIITASRASGGGATGNPKPPAGGKAFKDMTESERTALFRSDRPRFDKENAAFKAAGSPRPTVAAPVS
jgi:FtsZ-binding cell division protein ZapB